CDGEVKYVGKSDHSLYTRMYGYKNPGPSQITNVRNNARIRALLQSGAAVDILALPDNGLLHYGQFHVNLAAGLEGSLIAVIDPEWNGSRTIPDLGQQVSAVAGREILTPAVEHPPEVDPLQDVTVTQSPQPIASFLLVVQKTYYNR